MIGGQHFVPRYLGLRPHESSNHKGFAGRVLRWRLLDDPDATVYETDSMYTQGVVPERYLDRLPDNAEWV